MKIRKPAVAGMFYPAGERQLNDQLKLLIDVTGETEKINSAFGLVVPHAGYAYSGKTAAFGYNSIPLDQFETFIIISPSHREYFPGVSVYDGDAYETPLGKVPVNKEIVEKLIEGSKSIFKGEIGHRGEHALEVHVPFLQYLENEKEFSIVPVVMGDQGKVYIDELAEKLNEVTDDKTLIIASSDLSHFYTKEEANRLDSLIEKDINGFDFDKLQKDIENKNTEACGGGIIVALMKAAKLKGKKKAKVIDRSDSGDITGDNSEVVGYLSAVIYDGD